MNRRTGADDGVTLIEMVVAMTVMSIFMAIFTTGIVQSFRVVDGSESTAIVQSQLNIVFLRLDKELRYAAGITSPGPLSAGGYDDIYVEYLNTSGASAVCGELRLHVASGASNGLLQLRSWTASGQPGTTWTTLASGVSGATPFGYWPADATSNFQRLELNVTVSSGGGVSAASRTTDVTFTAMNSQPDDSADPADNVNPSVCSQWRS